MRQKRITEPSDKDILAVVTDFFVSSHDFNGILALRLSGALVRSWEDTRQALKRLLTQEKISIAFYSHQANPHIKRLPEPPLDEQIKLLYADQPDTFCIYPAATILQKRSEIKVYSDKPFTKRLFLGEAQLTPAYFDLTVLEKYQRDPRYLFSFYDSGGEISISDEAYESEEMLERDKILLQTFGIAYDQKRNRVVVVYLRYLSHLSPEHQQIWLAHVLNVPCIMNSDYARVTVYGEFPEYHSAYEALLAEMTEINKLCQIIGKPALFLKDYEKDRPRDFQPMLRPTKRNLHDFALLLDKMASDNLNKDFFRGDIPLEEEKERSDGKIEVQTIGTLNLLRNWLQRYYRTADGKNVSEGVVEALKKVRRLRQRPAHSIQDDNFDQTLPEEQDSLVAAVVRSFTKLRLILSLHPKAQGKYEAPSWLDGDKIVFY